MFVKAMLKSDGNGHIGHVAHFASAELRTDSGVRAPCGSLICMPTPDEVAAFGDSGRRGLSSGHRQVV